MSNKSQQMAVAVEDHIRRLYTTNGRTHDGLLVNLPTFTRRLLAQQEIISIATVAYIKVAVRKLWPTLHPKISTRKDLDLVIKSAWAQYCWNGSTFKGCTNLKGSILSPYISDLGRIGDQKLRADLDVRLAELQTYLNSGDKGILKRNFKLPPSSLDENTSTSKTSTSPPAQAQPQQTEQAKATTSSTENAQTSTKAPSAETPSTASRPSAEQVPATEPPVAKVIVEQPSASVTPISEPLWTQIRSSSQVSTSTSSLINSLQALSIDSTTTTKPDLMPSAQPAHEKATLANLSDEANGHNSASWDLMTTLVEEDDLLDNDLLGESSRIQAYACSRAICFSPPTLAKAATGEPITQYGLLGTRIPPFTGTTAKEDNFVLLNGNHPTSFFICGLQGQGKSHTLSCLLENFLIPSPILGRLTNPLSALVLHYDSFSSKQAFRPSEAVFLSSPSQTIKQQAAHVPMVNVLVSVSNYHAMKQAYEVMPNVRVRPLKLNPKDLNVSTLLTLMSVNTSDKPTLYMAQVLQLLRDLAAESPQFDYAVFRKRLDNLKLERLQETMLTQRLNLLDSFLDRSTPPASQKSLIVDTPGSLTVVDLSCPFVGEDMACILFKICIELFLGADSGAKGKVIAVDEAHKYMTAATPSAKDLTAQLLGIVRLQRHYGVRVIVATQEPTIDPMLIDLTSVKIVHKFTSPDWFKYLEKHLPVEKGGQEELWKWICRLKRGEAVVFDPSAILVEDRQWNSSLLDDDVPAAAGGTVTGEPRLVAMVDSCWRIKIRNRLTRDGGKSLLAV